MKLHDPLGVVDEETLHWYSLTPAQRFAEVSKLWDVYLSLGGSLDPEPDSQSPFFDPETGRTCPDLESSSRRCRSRKTKPFKRSKYSRKQVTKWMLTLRSTDLLCLLCRRYPAVARTLLHVRPLLQPALDNDVARLERAFLIERREGPRPSEEK